MTDQTSPDDASDHPAFDLSGFTPYRVAVAAQILSETLARQYRDRFGISIPDWRVLVHLAHSGGASVRDIENAVVMEKSKVSRTAARLEKRGLLAKVPHRQDKRLVHLTLTPEGKALLSDLLPIAAEFQARIEHEMGAAFPDFAAAVEEVITRFGDKA